jgi:hypothetical protein
VRARRGVAFAWALVSFAIGTAGCRGSSPAAVAAATTEVAAAAAVDIANAAIQRSAAPPETSHLAGDLNDPPPSIPQKLDVEHTRASLLEVDLSACWPTGVKRQPRDVQVTFRNDGTVVRVAVPAPRGLVTFDEVCVARRLKDIIVDPFLGPDVIVGVTYGEP